MLGLLLAIGYRLFGNMDDEPDPASIIYMYRSILRYVESRFSQRQRGWGERDDGDENDNGK
jgi:hypothetical protein